MSDWDNLTNRLSDGFGIIGGAVKDYLTAKTDEFNGVKTELIEKIDGLERKIDGLDGKIVGLDGKIVGVEGRITARIDGLNGRFDTLEGRIGGIESVLDDIRKSIVELLGIGKGTAAKLAKTQAQLKDKQTEIDKLKNDLNAAETALAAANNQISNLRGDLERTNPPSRSVTPPKIICAVGGRPPEFMSPCAPPCAAAIPSASWLTGAASPSAIRKLGFSPSCRKLIPALNF